MSIADQRATPRRGRPPKISQAQIVEAAIGLGLDSFTMQGIADHLGVTSPALYSHVAGREEVLDLVNATLRTRLHAFSSPATDWREWLTDFARLIRKHLAPSASTFISDARGLATADQLGLGERGLQLLIGEGFTPTEAGYAVWLVFRVAITAGPERETSFTGFVDDTGKLLGPDPTSTLPATEAVHTALASDGPHDTFDFDLQIVLDGLSRRLAGTSSETKNGSR